MTTDSLTLRVITDLGPGYLKVLSNKGTPHTLASEWVGTELAKFAGLPTLDYAVIPVPPESPIELAGGHSFTPGEGFITRAIPGQPWSGRRDELNDIANKAALGRMVAFDTWTLNCDRFRPTRGEVSQMCNRGNVFLSSEGLHGSALQVIPIDHGHCFKCCNDLTPAYLQRVTSDNNLFGLFPEFVGLARLADALDASDRIGCITRRQIEDVIARVPRGWLAEQAARTALADLILNRSRSLRRVIEDRFPPADLFDALP